MPRRRAAVLAVLLALVAPSPSRAAATAGEGGATIHLEREQASGYTRPVLDDDACLVAALESRPGVAGLDVRARFTVERDGTLSGLAFSPELAPAMAAAAEEALRACRWHPGLDPEGRPVVVRVTQPLRVRRPGAPPAQPTSGAAAAPGLPPPPVVLGGGSLKLDAAEAAGFRRPALEDPDCLARSLQGRRAAAGLENTVKFAVMRDGSVTHFSFLAPVAPEVEQAVVAAFEACSWRPALDPEGEPLAVWVVQPLKVAPMPPPPEVQRPLFP